MTAFDLIVLALATRYVLDAWLRGAIFTRWRARVNTWEGFWGKLLECRLCLSVHAALIITSTYWLVGLLDSPWSEASRLPIYGLAVAGAVRLLDQITNRRCCDGRQRGVAEPPAENR